MYERAITFHHILSVFVFTDEGRRRADPSLPQLSLNNPLKKQLQSDDPLFAMKPHQQNPVEVLPLWPIAKGNRYWGVGGLTREQGVMSRFKGTLDYFRKIVHLLHASYIFLWRIFPNPTIVQLSPS